MPLIDLLGIAYAPIQVPGLRHAATGDVRQVRVRERTDQRVAAFGQLQLIGWRARDVDLGQGQAVTLVRAVHNFRRAADVGMRANRVHRKDQTATKQHESVCTHD